MMYSLIASDPRVSTVCEIGKRYLAQKTTCSSRCAAIPVALTAGIFKGLGAVSFLQANDHLIYHAFDDHKPFPESAFSLHSSQAFKLQSQPTRRAVMPVLERFGPRFVFHEGPRHNTVPAAKVGGTPGLAA